MEEYDVDVVLGLLSLVPATEISFRVAGEPSWFQLSFEDSIVYDLKVFDDPGRFSIAHTAVPLRY